MNIKKILEKIRNETGLIPVSYIEFNKYYLVNVSDTNNNNDFNVSITYKIDKLTLKITEAPDFGEYSDQEIEHMMNNLIKL